MKAKSKYIKKAMEVLQNKGDDRSKLQLQVLMNNRSEQWVFNTYVRDRKGSEADYYAAREAAQFLAGALSLEEFIPDMNQYISTPAQQRASRKITAKDRDNITINRKTLENILARLNRLERLYGIRKVEIGYKHQEVSDDTPTDLISQADVIRELGVGKSTIKRWATRGYIKGYTKGSRVSYSRAELYASEVVKEYLDEKSMII